MQYTASAVPARPEAESWAKPSPNRPSLAEPWQWLHPGFGLACLTKSQSQAVRPGLFSVSRGMWGWRWSRCHQWLITPHHTTSTYQRRRWLYTKPQQQHGWVMFLFFPHYFTNSFTADNKIWLRPRPQPQPWHVAHGHNHQPSHTTYAHIAIRIQSPPNVFFFFQKPQCVYLHLQFHHHYLLDTSQATSAAAAAQVRDT